MSIILSFEIGIYKGATFEQDGKFSPNVRAALLVLDTEKVKFDKGDFRVEFTKIRRAVQCARRLLAVLPGLEITIVGGNQFMYLMYDSFKADVIEAERESALSKKALVLLELTQAEPK